MKYAKIWMNISVALLALSLIAPGAQANEPSTDSLSWRPVNGNNVIPGGDYPVTWSAEKNVSWKIDLPDTGNSTPVVKGDRIFVTQAINEGRKRGIICYSAADGKKRWEQFVAQEEDEVTHKTNPYCSGSAFVQGNRVVAWLGNSGVFAWTLDGEQLWHKDLGPIDHVFGYGTSPVIYKDTVYLNFGPGKHTFVVALDLNTGEENWRIPVTVDQQRYGDRPIQGSYATPVFAPNKKDVVEMITTFPGYIVSLDPASGKENWRCGGGDYTFHGSPSVNDNIVVALGGYMYESIAAKMGGSGDVTDTHRLWQHEKNLNTVSSPVIIGDHFYRTGGNFISCHELKTGNETWKERFSRTETWASPMLVGNLIYLVDKAAITTVFKPNPKKFEVVSVNETEEVMTNGSLAFANDAIYLRTHKSLWKFENEEGSLE
jgi:outer membrane protein assembly factor BamB